MLSEEASKKEISRSGKSNLVLVGRRDFVSVVIQHWQKLAALCQVLYRGPLDAPMLTVECQVDKNSNHSLRRA